MTTKKQKEAAYDKSKCPVHHLPVCAKCRWLPTGNWNETGRHDWDKLVRDKKKEDKQKASAEYTTNGHLPSCGKVVSEAEVAAWKVFLTRKKEKAYELWPNLSEAIKELMMDCYLEGKAEANALERGALDKTGKGIACHPLVASVQKQLTKGGNCKSAPTGAAKEGGDYRPLSKSRDDFEAALEAESIEVEDTLEKCQANIRGARWAREYTLAHQTDKCGAVYDFAIKKARTQIRKLWDETVGTRCGIMDDNDVIVEFERKLKELGE